MSGSTNTLSVGDAFSVSAALPRKKLKRHYTPPFSLRLTAEERLGLSGQPRATVFHEKNGRRHCHAVWSRIKVEEMKAV